MQRGRHLGEENGGFGRGDCWSRTQRRKGECDEYKEGRRGARKFI